MEILTTIWIISKYTFLIASISLLIAILFSLFHPIYLKFNFRTSLKGQRAEFWLYYFFKALKIGVVATPHTQDVLVRFLYWEKLIQRNSKISKKVSKPSDLESTQTSTPTPDMGKSQSETSIKSELEPDPDSQPDEKTKGSQPDKSTIDEPEVLQTKTEAVKVDSSDLLEPEKDLDAITEDTKTREVKDIEVVSKPDDSSDSHTPKAEDSLESDETNYVEPIEQAEPLLKDLADSEEEEIIPRPLSEVEKELSDKKEKEKQKEQPDYTKEIPIRKRLSNLKKLVSKKYAEGKKWIRFGLGKWKGLKPVLTRFWERSKAGFSIINPGVKCRYALHEPYLTGMFQGSMAILSGILARAGLEFVPVPEFGSPMIYVKGRAWAKIRPWKFFWAGIGIILEPQLWKEGFQLFKWYRAKQKAETKL